jgi:choline dehydrogenase-like flavoprotein
MMGTMAREAARADVVVLGGGLAGLAAALAFGRNGRRVLLIERDGRTDDGSADELFERWDRPGIARFRQPHNFLGLGRRVLLENAPDCASCSIVAKEGLLDANRSRPRAKHSPLFGDATLTRDQPQ